MKQFSSKQLFFGGLLAPIAIGALFALVFMVKNNLGGGASDGGMHIRGNKNAKIKIVEYSDFQCPFCERHYPTLKQIIATYGDKVSVEYKHFPLSFHPNAVPAAEASECAAEQGKFWEFHDAIFENQSSLSASQLGVWAEQLGLNMSKFNDCMSTHKYAAKVQAEYEEGQKAGVQGTPATFINGQLVSGAQPFEAFQAVIETELKK